MSFLIVILLLFVWLFLGWLLLSVSQIGDSVQRGLAAPAVGMASTMLLTTTASFAGVPIAYSMFIIVALLVGSLFLLRRVSWQGFSTVGLLLLFVLAINLLIVGVGFLWFGTSWQGLVNGDGAINALAAQYFSQHSYFSAPSAVSIANGLDYSPLSSQLYVWGGHRFGDVMLLGLTANIFQMMPDQVYMAHALAIRCALVATATLLIYHRGEPLRKLVLAILCLSLAPLAVYMYLNQLISQMGGMVLFIAAGVLGNLCLDQRRFSIRDLFVPSLLVAALFQSYPEAVAFMGLSVGLLLLMQAKNKMLPPVKTLLWALGCFSLLTVCFLTVSLPNIVSYALAIAKWGVSQTSKAALAESDFAYAFTPDMPTITFGFVTLREGVEDPWSVVGQLASIAFLLILTAYLGWRNRRFQLLAAFSVATVITFLFLFVQRNGFGTFKVMLLAQPFLFATLAALLYQLSVKHRPIFLLTTLLLFGIFTRTDVHYLGTATKALGGMPYLGQHHMLDRLSLTLPESQKGVVVESSSFLFGQYAVLRPKLRQMQFEQNFALAYASPSLRNLLKRPETSFDFLFVNHDAFWKDLQHVYKLNYTTQNFTCNTSGPAAEFDVLTATEDVRGKDRVVPGGALVPLNRIALKDEELSVIKPGSVANYLAYRPSSLGNYYGVRGLTSIYNLEPDPIVGGTTVAAVGRYVLLEVINAAEEYVRLSLRFSRTYFGGAESKLPSVTIYGTEPVKIWSSGAGAFNISSEPVRPCAIDGRKFLLIDFGIDAQRFKKTAPVAYRWLGVSYQPDGRLASGFLRDVSVISNLRKRDANPGAQVGSTRWNFEDFEAAFEFSGAFEDGWISNQLTLRPKSRVASGRVVLDLDVPGSPTGAPVPSKISIALDGVFSRTLSVQPGKVKIDIDVPIDFRGLITLSTDRPLVLPGGDERSVMGLLRSFSLN